jgi:hypothetical protein
MRPALAGLGALRPLTGARYQAKASEVKDLDQFVLRFTKLRDAVGSRLFVATLSVLQEPSEDWPMIDRINRLEKLGFLDNASDWEAIREARNKLTHEYPNDPDKRAAALDLSFDAAPASRTARRRSCWMCRG